ncbi:MAG TPA: hypothetical protein GXZ85_10350 [Firmicutes bacterium]|nr:hypothetical protein [Bacillota bacterium]
MKKGIGLQILLPAILGLMLLAIAIGVTTQRTVSEGTRRMALEKARSDLATIYEIIDSKFPGPWTIQGSSLYKGETMFNDNDELTDWLGELTGNTVTIFQNNVRIATNVMNEGKRAIGTQASAEVVQEVLNAKREFVGEAVVVGQRYQTAYRPLLDQNGKAIGMLYTGASQALVDEVIKEIAVSLVIISILALAVVSLALVWIIKRRITGPISTAAGAMERISELDFADASNEDISKIIERQDEIGVMMRAGEKMRSSLKEVVLSLQEISGQVARNSESLSAASEENAATIEEVASSSSEFNTRMGQAGAQAEEMRKDADVINDLAMRGASHMDLSRESMDAIVLAAGNVRESLSDLAQRAKNMVNVLHIISDIAAQTNLLALNAAIEAARAGDQGRGFAVVADEVRVLAEQTQTSVKEISQMVNALVEVSEQSSDIMTNAESTIASGTELLRETQKDLESIKDSIGDTVRAIQEITDAVLFAAESSNSITHATEEQASSTAEIASTANDLSNMALNLQTVIQKFRI